MVLITTIGIVDLDHIGVTFRGLGALTNQKLLSILRATEQNDHYLTGKDDDLIDDPGSLILQELLNNVVSDAAGPKDCEVLVSRHELTLVYLCGISDSIRAFALLYLSAF